MKRKRSIWTLLVTSVSLGLLVNNCVIKSSDEDDGASCKSGAKKSGCECADKSTGYQVCGGDGVYGSCVCPSAEEGGGSSVGGGAPTSGGYGGTVGDSGAGGEAGLNIQPDDCAGCLVQLCSEEWDACTAEDETNPPDPTDPGEYCLSSSGNDSGQIEKILDCINNERAKGLVKRDAVRACGSSLGSSADSSFFQWPPTKMTPATEALMNCMADAPDETTPGAWATSESNFPEDGGALTPWPDMTCAKFSCTSKL